MITTKKVFIFLGLAATILIGLLFLLGITTDFPTDKIANNEIEKCKEIVEIIDRNKGYINNGITKSAVGDGTCIRYHIENAQDIDNLFSKISINDKRRFAELVESKFCESIEIGEAENCIMFLMKTSRHDWSIIGKYKRLYIIYEKTPKCNCKDNPIGAPNYPEYVKKISENWFQTKVEISTRYLHA